MNLTRQAVAWLLVSLTFAEVSLAEDSLWQGRPVVELLEDFNRRGFTIIFSSDAVTAKLLVVNEPRSPETLASLEIVLRTHGLNLAKGPADSWLVIPQKMPESAAIETAVKPPLLVPLPELVVTSSLHKLEYLNPGTHTYIDRELATRIPAAAEETVRITSRLPGTASGGLSARTHVRGGEANEVLFLLDGLRLYEPFHLKDFQSIATIVNSNAVDGIEFFSGAYPARFGDRMSGVIQISLREPTKPIETELSLSFFNTSALSLGTFGGNDQGDWLFAARRGNLDLIADAVNPDIGSPDYQDYLLHAAWDSGSRMKLSANVLYSKDKLRLADIGRGESASAVYENQVLWLKWSADWTADIRSQTIFSISDISSRRVGWLDLPGIVAGSLSEERAFDAIGIRQDWTIVPASRWMLGFGLAAKHQDAEYRFESLKTVVAPFDQILDNLPSQSRSFDLSPEGAQFGAYVELRWRPHPKLILDTGLRWDHQSYTTADSDLQTSPRFSALYQIDDRTELRLGWGQFSQAQEINELQASDGITDFFAAQRAEHIIVNLKRQFGNDINLDASYYRKGFRSLRPRFENAFNSLTLLPEIQFDRYRIDPISSVARGAEVALSKGSAEQSVFWWVSYTWSEVIDRTATEKVARSWDQTHTVKAGLSWSWGHWDISMAGEVHSGWPRTELRAGTNTNVDGSTSLSLSTVSPNTERFSVFQSLDTRISRDFKVRRGELTAFLEVTNLYDRKNVCCTEYSVAASSSSSALSGRAAHWLPLVPSVGVIWRF